jgi:hypothetical protein
MSIRIPVPVKDDINIGIGAEFSHWIAAEIVHEINKSILIIG